MIEMKMFCNIKEDMPSFAKMANCEVLILQNTKAQVKVKNKNGQLITDFFPKDKLTNFRYMAWYNGIKTEFQVAKKLARMSTIIYNATGQNWNLIGNLEIPEIKKLIDQMLPYVEYYEKKQNNNRNR